MAASCSINKSGTVYESSSTRQHDHPAPGRMREHDIFLSHSGKQKVFVKDLYKMLSPRYVTFFDITHHSLPLTERFPDHIFDAAQRCKLAVVVLSDEFLCSKWPMLELCAFVEAKSVKILPLFFKLSPTDLKDKNKLKGWVEKWEDHAKHDPSGRIKVSSWKEALKKLCSLNGLVFQDTESEQSYLQEIMSSILREILPRAVKYEESGIQGKDRLCKIILAKFEDMEFKQPTTSQQSTLPPQNKVHVLGMYGPSGSGKSTLARCLHEKNLINFKGKAHYLELPTNPSIANLVQTCKDLLNYLTYGFHSDVQLQLASGLRQMYYLFKVSNLQHVEVFLMLDNISADRHSIELVQNILRLCVGPGSKVLLVARTYNVLRLCQDNLAEYYVCDTVSVPSLNEKEAINVLLQRGGGVGSDTSYGPEKDLTPRDKEMMEKVVRMSGFGDPKGRLLYLPLVLEIMGHSFRECRLDHAVEWGIDMLSFWRKVEGCKKDAVRELVQESFEKLSLELQLLFLDLALFYLPVYGCRIKDACDLLSLMHECSPEAIESQMYRLERSCFLSMQDKWAVGQFCVHDVFLEFAASLPESSKYYLSHEHHPKVSDEVPRTQAQEKCDIRVIVLDQLGAEECTRLDFPMSFSSVRILSVRNSKSLRVLGLSAGLTSLVSLEIVNCPSINCIEIVDGNHLQSLKRLSWRNEQENISVMMPQRTQAAAAGGQWWPLNCLYRMIKEGIRRPPTRAALIGAVDLASQFRCLQALRLENTGTTRLEDLSRFWPQLEELEVFENHLQHFEVGNLPGLKRFLFSDAGRDHVLNYYIHLHEISSDDDSQRMYIRRENLLAQCPKLEDVRICSSQSAFENGIGMLTSTKLRILCIIGVPVQEMVLDHASLPPSSSLQQLFVRQCENLEILTFGSQFGDLIDLYIMSCTKLVQIHGLEGFTSLRYLSIVCCTSLTRIHGLEGLTSLRWLKFWGCTNLTEIHGLERCTSLRVLGIGRCTKLAKIHRLEGLTSLEMLGIEGCTNLAEIHVLEGLTSLESLRIDGCTNLAKIHGLEGLTSLQALMIAGCTNLVDIHGLQGLTGLQHLSIEDCTALAEIHGLEGLTSLQNIIISGCTNLLPLHHPCLV